LIVVCACHHCFVISAITFVDAPNAILIVIFVSIIIEAVVVVVAPPPATAKATA
jgi:hypothetical protein